MKQFIEIKVGKNHTISDLIEFLIDFGYQQNGELISGSYHYIGDTVTIFPVNNLLPVRIEFFGKKIEKISEIDSKSGRKAQLINNINIEPNRLLLAEGTISPEEYVVHEDHGVGLFSHKETLLVEGEEITYVVLKYFGEDLLRVPPAQIVKLSRYFGIGRKRPKLNKLGSGSWQRTYQKTYENIIQMAKELLFVYASREISHKIPLTINKEWDQNITESFGFKETLDQASAIKDVYHDLGGNIPMDRLICGDVGFGKTEVAIRALTQAAANGKQSAILVPTTILAEQHFVTFCERFKNLPVKIARLSRFVNEAEKAEIIKGLKSGKIDILVSTHAILRSEIPFKNLGLLVVDEEQKFGVKDKEKLKKIKKDIDVLTLTATPIPRTLFMALSGLRDISVISTIPVGRQSIITQAEKYDDRLINNAIKREIGRKGQVYYLHNQVSTIAAVARKIKKEFPDYSVAIAHGQMPETTLSSTMSKFAAGQIDILVCSTIIENGLDLPNVNTLIVDESDRFGLSQLYQIRGRIGRSKTQAYALFTYRTKLSLNATKRLKTLVENIELGSGYNIALHDLEIRGGGNILGKDQHGNMEAVGLILYGKLLNMAVDKLKSTRYSVINTS